jgi:hypothetical protein
MTIRTLASFAPALVLAVTLAACSKAPSFEGSWRSADGNLMTLQADSVALLGMEGVEGHDAGRWSVSHDTLRVLTDAQVDGGGAVRNEFVFLHARDTLHLLGITLYRPGDTRSTSGEQLARSTGKPLSRFAFTRAEEGK